VTGSFSGFGSGCPETGWRKEGALMAFEEKDAARGPEENQPRAEDRIIPGGREEEAAGASAQTAAAGEPEGTVEGTAEGTAEGTMEGPVEGVAEEGEKEKKKKKKTTRARKNRKKQSSKEEAAATANDEAKEAEQENAIKEEPEKAGTEPAQIVMPTRVQVKVNPGAGGITDGETLGEDDTSLVRIKVKKAGFDEAEAVEAGDEVVTAFQGAQVQVGEARSRVIPAVPVTRLPAAAVKIRNITGEVRDVCAEIIPDKVIIQGIIHKQVFFVGIDGVIRHFAEDIPFSTFIDVPGAEPGMNVQVHPVIEKILFHLAADGRSVVQKIILEIFVKVTQFVQVGLEIDEGPLLLLPSVIGEATKQHLVEEIVELDQPAEKVDEIRGELRDLQVEIIPDKVIIQGIIHKQIFFVDQNNLARHQEEEVPFSLFLDIPGAEPGMEVQVHPVIEKILFELLSPLELRQKVIIEVFVKVTERIQERVRTGDGPLFKVEQVIGEGQEQLLKESVVELERPAVKIREIVGEVRDVSAHVIPDKVIIQGILHKQIFFITTDNIERHQMEDVPFGLFIDIPGAAPGLNAHVKILIEQIIFHLDDDRILRQKAILQARVVVTETIQAHLVTTDFPLFKLEQVIGEGIRQLLVERAEVIPEVVRSIRVVRVVPQPVAVTGEQQIIVENVVELPEKAIKIREVRGEITDLRARIIAEGKVLVEGIVHKQVFFVNRNNVVQAVTEEVPFSVLVQVPGLAPDTPIRVNVQIENISFTLSADGRFLRQLIVLRARVEGDEVAPEPFDVVTEVTGPGITTERILVRAPVLTETGVVEEEFFAVTDVSGPGILRVDKAVVPLDVVGDGIPEPVPVEVVTNVVFAPVTF
jgi:outer membrane biosynthesis protein TonB